MNNNYTIFVVDDDRTTRLLLKSMLDSRYSVQLFDSAEACLQHMRETGSFPDLFLLDVGLPGIDGYELCRQVKAAETTAQTPVVFLSGHDDPNDVLAGYDAGGQDYVLKPFDVVELDRKIQNLGRIEADRKQLLEQARASDELATLVLANLDEYAILIRFLRALNECSDHLQVVQALQNLLDTYRLDTAVQVRLRGIEQTYSKSGENWPLEIAVIRHVRTLGRLFQFRSRAAYNYDHVTVLVTNMPIEDPDLCGRVRDNVAIATESANAKLAALQSDRDKMRLRDEIDKTLSTIGATLERYGRQYDDARYRGTVHTAKLVDDLTATFSRLGMSDQQEDQILEMVRQRSEQLVDFYDFAGDAQATLGALGDNLRSILSETGVPAGAPR